MKALLNEAPADEAEEEGEGSVSRTRPCHEEKRARLRKSRRAFVWEGGKM